MPIFEYVCKECEHRFEVIVRTSEKTKCPSCTSVKLEKQLSVFAPSTGVTRSNGFESRQMPVAACGTCGDPRGPGSCSTN